MDILARRKIIVNVAAVALLGCMAVLMFASAWNDSLTNDEAAHIGAGFSYLRKEDYRMNPEHPPLMKDLGGFPLLLMKPHVDWNHKSWTEDPFGQWEFGQRLIFNSGKDPTTITRSAKAPIIVFTVALGCFVFWWTREHFGDAVALLSTFFYAFSPTFLAHGRFVTTDVGAAAGSFIGAIGFLRFLKNPAGRNILVAGLAMAFAFLTKFSTVLLVPIALILAVAWGLLEHGTPARRGVLRVRKLTAGILVAAWRAPQNRLVALLRYVTRTVGIIVIAYLAIYPVYLHHTLKYPPQRQRKDAEFTLVFYEVTGTPKEVVLWASEKPGLRPWAEYFLGLFATLGRSTKGNSPFFLGTFTESGSRLYFPFVYLVKEPLALHVLTIVALVFALSRVRRPLLEWQRQRQWLEAHFTEFAFVVVIVVYCWAAIRSHLNIGVRHLMPVFPFIYILVANEITVLHRRLLGRPAAIGVFRFMLGALLAWQAVTVLRVHPSYLPYFNEIAGGPNGGWRYVSDSNIDWGQDLKRLSEFVEQRGITLVHLDYFGAADPAYYLKGKYRELSSCSEPVKGWVAVSAMAYQESRRKPECDYRRWLPLEKLVTKIGYAIFVFRID